jgi:hypothetical protein
VIGGGLVGVELFGELTAFADGIVPLYKHVNREEVRFILLFALLFRPDAVKISLESEEDERRGETSPTRPAPGPSKEGAAIGAGTGRPLLPTGRSA